MTWKVCRIVLVAGFPALAGIMLTACEPPAEAPPEGNLSPDPIVEGNLSPDPIVVLGDGPDELFQSVRHGVLLDDGQAVVADAGRHFLRVYAPDGDRMREIGRPGEGPGEFVQIAGVWRLPDERVGVWDPGQRRITVVDVEDGSAEVSTVTAADAELAGNFDFFVGTLTEDEVVLGQLSFGPRGQSDGPAVFDRGTLVRARLSGEVVAQVGEFDNFARVNGSPIPFSPVLWATTHGDSTWVVEGYDPRASLFGPDGDLVRTLELPLEAPPVGDALTALEAELRGRSDRTLQLEQLEWMPRPERLPAVAGLLVDDRGRLWVKSFDPTFDSLWLKPHGLLPGPGGVWHVLSSIGEPITTVELPAGVVPLDVRGDLLLGVARDEFDVESVGVYRVGG